MNIPDEFMLGIKDFKPMDIFEFPKGMYRNITHGKKDEDSIERIENWCQGGYYRNSNPPPPDWKPLILKNESVSGFRFSGFQSRCSTDNKVVEVQDPRGFTLEITVSNLIDLLGTTVIENGVMKNKCVWGFDRSPVLLDVDGEDYKKHEAFASKTLEYLKARELVVGKTYVYTSRKKEMLYMYFGRMSVKLKGSKNYRGPLTDIEEHDDMFLFLEENERYKHHSFVCRKSVPKLLDADVHQVMATNFTDEKNKIDKNTGFSYPQTNSNLYNESLVEANFHDLNMTIKA